MKKFVAVCIAAFTGLCLLTAPQHAQARPQYNTAFGKKYEAVKEAWTKKKCATCHGDKEGMPGGDRKKRSDYAKELAKALGAKNVKDADKINEAFDEIAKMKVKDGEETTYGDLLKDGKLPPPYKDKD